MPWRRYRYILPTQTLALTHVPSYPKLSSLRICVLAIVFHQGLSRTVIEKLEPMLHSFKPSIINEIYFQKFTLGEVPFSFSNMRMIKEVDGKAVEGVLEFLMDIRWAGDINIALAVSVAGSDLCQVCLFKPFVASFQPPCSFIFALNVATIRPMLRFR